MDRDVSFPDLPTEPCDGDAAAFHHISGPFAVELCNSLKAHRQLLAKQLDEWAQAEEEMIRRAMANCASTRHVRRSSASATQVDSRYSRVSVRAAPPIRGELDGEAAVCDSYDFDDMKWKAAAHREAVRVNSTFRTSSVLLPGMAYSAGRTGLTCCAQKISTSFEIFFALVIICNSVTIGCEVEYVISNNLAERPVPFVVINHVFTALFLLELLLRMGVERLSFFSARHRFWNLFDVVVVVCALLELVFEVLQHTNRYGFGNLRALRFVRMVRILRVLRIPRIIRYVNALYHLVCSLTCTIKNLFWAFVLLTLILYLFGIVFAQVVYDHVRTPGNSDDDGTMGEFWGSLGASMFTLFMCVTDGLSWRLAIQPLKKIHGFWVVVFTVFYAFIFFAVLNVVTAAFVQSSIEGAARDIHMITMSTKAKEEAHVQVVEKLFAVLDSHKTGFITLDQFNENIETESVKAYLALLDLHTSNAWKLFKLLDVNGDHKVSLEEFLDGSLRLRGQAKSIDLALIQYEQKWMRKKFSMLMSPKGDSKPRDVVVI